MTIQKIHHTSETVDGWECTCGKVVHNSITMRQLEMEIHDNTHLNEDWDD